MYLNENHIFENLYKTVLFENELVDKDSFNMVDVDSAMVNKVGYDKKKRILQVEFNDGALYQYFDVPKKTYLDFFKRDSIGKYAHKNVRFSYDFLKV